LGLYSFNTDEKKGEVVVLREVSRKEVNTAEAGLFATLFDYLTK